MSRKTNSPAIPEGGEDAVQALKESVEIGLGRRGNPLETFVTFRDLEAGGFNVQIGRGGTIRLSGPGGSGGSGGEPGTGPGGPIDIGDNDPTPPPAPRNVVAKGLSGSAIAVSWSPPNYNNHRYAEVFASKADNWAHIQTTFDLSRPMGPGNRTQYFMGIAASTLFIHRSLESTVPALNTQFTVSSISITTDTQVFIDGEFSVSVGQTMRFSGAEEWLNAGYSAEVIQVLPGSVVLAGQAPTEDLAPNAQILLLLNEDELDAALNPDPVYYWVRFVSQAGVVGPVQSQAGIPGSVFINTKQVLDVLTGRIRESHLVNSLLTPIEYVRGPLVPRLDRVDDRFVQVGSEFDQYGRRLDLVDFQIGEIDVAFDILAQQGDNFAGILDNLAYQVTDTGARLVRTEGFQVAFGDPDEYIRSVATTLDTLRLSADANQSSLHRVSLDQAVFETDISYALASGLEELKITTTAEGAELFRLRVDQAKFETDSSFALTSAINELTLTSEADRSILNRRITDQAALITETTDALSTSLEELALTATVDRAELERTRTDQVAFTTELTDALTTSIRDLTLSAAADRSELSRLALDQASLFTNQIEGLATSLSLLDLSVGLAGSQLSRSQADQVNFISVVDGYVDSLTTSIEDVVLTATAEQSQLIRTAIDQAAFENDSALTLATASNDLILTANALGSRVERIEVDQASFLDTVNNSLESFATRFEFLDIQAGKDGAYVDLMRGIEATFYRRDNDGITTTDDVSGAYEFIARASENYLVTANEAAALARIASNLTVGINGDDYALNEIEQAINLAAGGDFSNTITLKVQADQNGVLTAAGFGVGLEGILDDPASLRSTFAVSADQFAIMGAGRRGRHINRISNATWSSGRWAGRTIYRLSVGGVMSVPDGLTTGELVTVPSSPVALPMDGYDLNDVFRGRTYEVVSRSDGFNVIWIGLLDSNGNPTNRPHSITKDGTTYTDSNYYTLPEQRYVVFPEANIPFIVDTASSTVGIRGKLVVDGLIRASDADIDRLTATKVLSESIVTNGLLTNKGVIGQALTTEQQAGWAVRISKPNFQGGPNRVLQFSRWDMAGWNGGTLGVAPADGFPAFDASEWPQLNIDTTLDTAFWVGTRQIGGQHYGEAYIKGSLTVGAGARIYTNTPISGTGDHFVQMDREFPLAVLSKNGITDNYDSNAGGLWNAWNYSSSVTQYVRSNALFWVQKNGNAGFNTTNNAIYVNGNPLEVPNGRGYVRVKSRFDPVSGTTLGGGRVMVNVNFSVTNNQGGPNAIGPAGLIGCTYALFLVDAATLYGVDNIADAQIRLPSDTAAMAGIPSNSPLLPYLDQHFVIIRGTNPSATVDGRIDPGYKAFQNWEAAHNSTIRKITEYWEDNIGGRSIAGAVDGIAPGDYKVLVVIVERYTTAETPVLPAHPSRLFPTTFSPISQQVATVLYDGAVGGGRSVGDLTYDPDEFEPTFDSTPVIAAPTQTWSGHL